MGDTSLIFSIIARDKTGTVFKKIEARAASTGSLVAKALGPAVTPVVAASTGAILGMGGALVAAGAAAGVFGGVLAASVSTINENATKFQDLTDKAELYGRQAAIMKARGEENGKMLKKQAAALLELEARLSLLPPAERAATKEYMGMKAGWQAFVDANKPATFSFLASGYKLIGQVITKLQPLFDIGRAAAARLLAAFQNMVNNSGIERLFQQAGPAMASLTSIIINIARAVTGMFSKFTGRGQHVLNWIEEMTRRWAEWATSTKAGTGINQFVSYVNANSGQVLSVLGNIASAAIHIAQAMAPLAPISLAIASALTSIITAIPPSVITTLVSAWLAFQTALKLYAVYSAIATAAQWAQNAAFLASPVTWIILAIVALIAVIVLVATKTRFFQTVWAAIWGFMKGVGAWFAGPFANFFVQLWNKIVASLNRAKSQFMSVFNAVVGIYRFWWTVARTVFNNVISAFGRVVSFFRSAPGRIRGALSGMFNGLWSGFRAVVNRIVSGWNNLSFGVPGFSFAGMSFDGFSVGTPNLPYLDKGTSMVRQSGLAVIHRGEAVTPARVTPFRSTAGGGGGATIRIEGNNTRVVRVLMELLREGIRDAGGDVVEVLTPR